MQGNLSYQSKHVCVICGCGKSCRGVCLFLEEVTVEILVIKFLNSCMAPYTSGTNYLNGHLFNENKRSKVKTYVCQTVCSLLIQEDPE